MVKIINGFSFNFVHTFLSAITWLPKSLYWLLRPLLAVWWEERGMSYFGIWGPKGLENIHNIYSVVVKHFIENLRSILQHTRTRYFLAYFVVYGCDQAIYSTLSYGNFTLVFFKIYTFHQFGYLAINGGLTNETT